MRRQGGQADTHTVSELSLYTGSRLLMACMQDTTFGSLGPNLRRAWHAPRRAHTRTLGVKPKQVHAHDTAIQTDAWSRHHTCR
jgi:hypothetical protein